MKVEVVVDPNQLQSLASRVAPTPTRSAAPARGRPARGGGKARAPRPVKKTTEDLDAELNVSMRWRGLIIGLQDDCRVKYQDVEA
jgi:hypothetical protein